MSDLYIEKRRLPVTLALRGGQSVDGQIFVQSSAHGRGGPEGVPEFMNSADRFFPLLMPETGVQLVAKHQVVAVHFSRDLLDEAAVYFGEPAEAVVTMDDGSTYSGEFLLNGLPSHRRVSDHLNYADDPFVPLLQDHRVTLLACAHIVRVFEPGGGVA